MLQTVHGLPVPNPLVLTTSAIQAYLSCPKKYYYQYVRRLSTQREAGYFTLGRGLHAVQQALAQGFSIGDALKHCREELYASKKCDAKEIDRLVYLLGFINTLHTRRWAAEDAQYEPLQIELEFDWEVEPGFHLLGRVDRVVQHKTTGMVFLWETKTTAATGAHYWKRALWSVQERNYLAMLQQTKGLHVNHVIRDVIKKPSIKPGPTEPMQLYYERLAAAYLNKPTAYFERRPLYHKQAVIDKQVDWLKSVADQIRYSYRTDNWLTNHDGSYYPCPMERLCEAEQALEEEEQPSALRFYRVRTPAEHFPELTPQLEGTGPNITGVADTVEEEWL